jgi:hypothetical protein
MNQIREGYFNMDFNVKKRFVDFTFIWNLFSMLYIQHCVFISIKHLFYIHMNITYDFT